MALRDTINEITDRAKEAAKFEENKPDIIAKWQTSIEWLEHQFENWLSEYVNEGSIHFLNEKISITEELLGTYEAQAMKIVVGSILIRVQPVARIIIGATGRVDMYRQGRSNDPERVLFMRTDPNKIDSWKMRRPVKNVVRPPPVEEFTKEAFESAIEGLLTK